MKNDKWKMENAPLCPHEIRPPQAALLLTSFLADGSCRLLLLTASSRQKPAIPALSRRRTFPIE
jgi:hypothetical protein